ncbi:MAG TPA: hypothetical protein VNE39_24625 [Planctomycetota bacterium]|nr:hypothetical protein [Planctomycetota bacterium]
MQYLLSGGQACIFYGGTEFSRDADIVVLASAGNLAALQAALRELDAEQIFVPPLEAEFLDRGHACHFRCRCPGAEGIRLDVMSVLRGCDPFPNLWARRAAVEVQGTGEVPVLSLPDLVQSKKTQRDKDWGHIRRLVESDYLARRSEADEEDMLWWLAELRTAPYLIELVRARPELVTRVERRRWLAERGLRGEDAIGAALLDEEQQERADDRAYWAPLRRELEHLRQSRRSDG